MKISIATAKNGNPAWTSLSSSDVCEDDINEERDTRVRSARCELIILFLTFAMGSCALILLGSVYFDLNIMRLGQMRGGDGMGGSLPQANVCNDTCVLSIVESIPQNLTYNPHEYIHMSTYSGLKILLSLATESVHIASYYWTLKGDDISFHDDSASEGEDVFNTLMDIGKAKKVSIKIAQNAENNDTALLAQFANAHVRTLNFTQLVGSGILHTKFWVVDGRHFYIGSANLDWRSLTQVKELGVLVQDCPCLASDVEKLFDVYWYLGADDAQIPKKWPALYSTTINSTNPITVTFNNTQAPIFLSSSPPSFCPLGRTGDIDAILKVIGSAKNFVYIAVMDYSPTTLYNNPNFYWPVIDDALRNATFNNNISVRLLASKWSHSSKDMFAFLCSLQMLGGTHHPKMHIDVRLFKVPIYTRNQSQIPFSRVNHNKYMVTDQHAYIGTSNWSGDYFTTTGGVGFILEQPEQSCNTTKGNFRKQLKDVFLRDWYSNFSEPLVCNISSSGPKFEL